MLRFKLILTKLNVEYILQVKALFDFESGGPGELSFSVNEVLTIIRQVRTCVYLLRFCSNLW